MGMSVHAISIRVFVRGFAMGIGIGRAALKPHHDHDQQGEPQKPAMPVMM